MLEPVDPLQRVACTTRVRCRAGERRLLGVIPYVGNIPLGTLYPSLQPGGQLHNTLYFLEETFPHPVYLPPLWRSKLLPGPQHRQMQLDRRKHTVSHNMKCFALCCVMQPTLVYLYLYRITWYIVGSGLPLSSMIRKYLGPIRPKPFDQRSSGWYVDTFKRNRTP